MTNQFFKAICTMFFVGIAFSAFSQQTPYLSFYRYNWQVINPAAMDKSFIFNEDRPFIISGNYRQQWVGQEGAPKFFYASMEHKPVGAHPVKWGFQGFGDITDGYETYGSYFNFSYYLKLRNTKAQFLHFGISPGIIQQKLALGQEDFEELEPDLVPGETKWYADFALGIFYRHGTQWYAGLSAPQVLSPILNATDGSRWFPTERTHHYFLLAGAFFEGNYYGVIESSLWLRYAPGLGYQTIGTDIPLSADLNLRYHSDGRYDQITFWGGGGLGTSKYVHIEAGANFPFNAVLNSPDDKVSVGLIFSIPFGQSGLNLGRSLEFNFAYAWD